jgi:hypothetical protein
MSFTVSYSISASPDRCISAEEKVFLMSATIPPFGQFSRCCLYVSYPLTENMCALLRCSRCRCRLSWGNSVILFSLVALFQHCRMQSSGWPVALLCSPPVTAGDSESQSVAWLGPLWGWGSSTVPPRLWHSGMTPHRSNVSCMAMWLLMRKHPIIFPRQVGWCHPTSVVEVFTQGVLLPKDSCRPKLTSPSYPDLWSVFTFI